MRSETVAKCVIVKRMKKRRCCRKKGRKKKKKTNKNALVLTVVFSPYYSKMHAAYKEAAHQSSSLTR